MEKAWNTQNTLQMTLSVLPTKQNTTENAKIHSQQHINEKACTRM